jgi:hypothetical protein
MNLLEQINALWTDDLEAKTCGWARDIAAKKELIESKTTRFHEWAPLYVYTSVARVKGSGAAFSLRYEGQEVAELDVREKNAWLNIGQRTRDNNIKYFGVNLEGRWPWQGQEAATFRRAFRDRSPRQDARSTEKRVEAEFLRQMVGDSSKFDGTLKHIRPVLIAGCPFQFPLPISGNKGEPEVNRNGKGNIDILARRGTGAASRLSIWELKAPGAEKGSKPIEQGYIYAVQLLKMLRSPSGRIWFQDVLGYRGELPERLVIESVAAVCPGAEVDRTAFQQRLADFKKRTPLTIETDGFKDEIRPLAAYYQERPLRVELLK